MQKENFTENVWPEEHREDDYEIRSNRKLNATLFNEPDIVDAYTRPRRKVGLITRTKNQILRTVTNKSDNAWPRKWDSDMWWKDRVKENLRILLVLNGDG